MMVMMLKTMMIISAGDGDDAQDNDDYLCR